MSDTLLNLDLKRISLKMRGPHLIATLDHLETRNALTDELMHELDVVLDSTADDLTIRSLVLRGSNGVFCAGADLKAALKRIDEPFTDTDPVATMNCKVGDLYLKLNEYPKATVAVVEGAAFGGGFGMACCADMVIVGDKALFALSETSLGLPPAQIAPYVVTRLGESVARRLAVTGLRIDASEAMRIGLADEHYSDADLEDGLTTLLNRIGKCAPGANAISKRIFQSSTQSVEKAAAAFADCLRSEEGREGVAAFNEKRPASWVAKV